MVILDLFSGIGGFSKGLQDAGFQFSKHYFSEVDKHAIAAYRYNFKNSEYVGAIESIQQAQIERPNIITFGSPCQDFSQAGLRKGMGGERSSLIQKAIELVTYYQPSLFIWENVKGVFSSNNGEDFWAIIQAFANIGGYRLEWQLLDTLWIHPQSRKRIYLVGHFATPGRSAKQVFPIREADCLHYKSRGNKEEIHQDHYALTITARGAESWKGNYVYHQQKGYRKLTEIEKERLQGFPDDWTKYGDYNGQVKEIAMSNRYRMIGNSVTTKVVEMIGKKLLAS